MGDSPRTPGRSAVTVLFSVAVCALLATATLTVLVLGDDTPEESGPVAVAAVRPSPSSPTPAVRTAAGPPMCLLGSWRTVDEHFMVKFYTDQPPLPFVASGRTFVFRADGTGTESQDGVVFTGTFRGNQLRIVGKGSVDFTWTAGDSAITYLAQTGATLAWSYYDQRGLLSTQPLVPNPNLNEVDSYSCQGSQLAESNPADGYGSAWVRTAGYGMYG